MLEDWERWADPPRGLPRADGVDAPAQAIARPHRREVSVAQRLLGDIRLELLGSVLALYRIELSWSTPTAQGHASLQASATKEIHREIEHAIAHAANLHKVMVRLGADLAKRSLGS